METGQYCTVIEPSWGWWDDAASGHAGNSAYRRLHIKFLFNMCVQQVGNADMVKLLLIHGADPSIVNEEGRTPFQLTSSKQVETAYFSSLFSAVFKQEYVLLFKDLSITVNQTV